MDGYLVYSKDTTNLVSFSDIFSAPFFDDSVWVIYAYDKFHEILGAIVITIATFYNCKTTSRYGSIEYIISIKKGIGTILLQAAEQWFKDHSDEMTHKIIQVISLKSSVGFYITLGYDYYDEKCDIGTELSILRKSL
jgi:GNAT superfamily N-acetyltransferase